MLYGPYADISGDVGILSTPAIDLQRGVMYVVSENLEDHAPMFYLHAIDLLNGSEQLGGPVAIRGAVPGSGLRRRPTARSRSNQCSTFNGRASCWLMAWSTLPSARTATSRPAG